MLHKKHVLLALVVAFALALIVAAFAPAASAPAAPVHEQGIPVAKAFFEYAPVLYGPECPGPTLPGCGGG